MDFCPVPIICFQCGTDQNPCHCKVVGPTLGFIVTIGAAVSIGPSPATALRMRPLYVNGSANREQF